MKKVKFFIYECIIMYFLYFKYIKYVLSSIFNIICIPLIKSPRYVGLCTTKHEAKQRTILLILSD